MLPSPLSAPFTPTRVRVALLGLAMLAAGCTRSLTIELQTDLAPGSELGHVSLEVLPRFVPADGVAEPVYATTYQPSAAHAAELQAGRRVAEVGLRPGTYTIRLIGRRPVASGANPAGGDLIAERDLVTTLQADSVVRVVVARGALVAGERCRVSTTDSCPGADGDPQRAADRATECFNGRCVDPRCDPSISDVDHPDHQYCCDGPSCVSSARCTQDSECTNVGVLCAEPRCLEGACILIDRAGACEADEYCDRTDGACVPVPGAGPRVPDAGPPEDADPTLDACRAEVCGNGVDDDCDGVLDCEDTECAGAACDDGDACTHTDVCDPSRTAGGSCAGMAVADGTSCLDDGNECTTDVCALGRCTHPNLTDGQRCSLGRCCSGTCFDVLSDPTNCGVCGIRCPGAEAARCTLGSCEWLSSPDCIAAGYGPRASSFMMRCQCRCNDDPNDYTARCSDQCPGTALCEQREGVNVCFYPDP